MAPARARLRREPEVGSALLAPDVSCACDPGASPGRDAGWGAGAGRLGGISRGRSGRRGRGSRRACHGAVLEPQACGGLGPLEGHAVVAVLSSELLPAAGRSAGGAAHRQRQDGDREGGRELGLGEPDVPALREPASLPCGRLPAPPAAGEGKGRARHRRSARGARSLRRGVREPRGAPGMDRRAACRTGRAPALPADANERRRGLGERAASVDAPARDAARALRHRGPPAGRDRLPGQLRGAAIQRSVPVRRTGGRGSRSRWSGADPEGLRGDRCVFRRSWALIPRDRGRRFHFIVGARST